MAIAGYLARAGHHTGAPAAGGLTGIILKATVDRGAELVGAERREDGAIAQVIGIEGATGRGWVLHVAQKGPREVPELHRLDILAGNVNSGEYN